MAKKEDVTNKIGTAPLGKSDDAAVPLDREEPDMPDAPERRVYKALKIKEQDVLDRGKRGDLLVVVTRDGRKLFYDPVENNQVFFNRNTGKRIED